MAEWMAVSVEFEHKLEPSANIKVAACAHFVRSGEHGSESRAGNLRTLSDSTWTLR